MLKFIDHKRFKTCSDKDLREIYLSNSRESSFAFEALIARNTPFIWNAIKKCGFYNGEGEEIFLRTLEKISQHIAQFNPKLQTITGWCWKIAFNTCIDVRRTQKVHKIDYRDCLPKTSIYSTILIIEQVELTDHVEQVIRQIKKLSPIQQKIILLRGEGYQYNEIAKITNMSIGGVKSGVFRARKHLEIIKPV